MKFKHLEQVHLGPQAAARFEFPEIAGCPWLEVRPAGESNRGYTAAVLKQPDKQRMLRGRMTLEEIKREREQAIPLYAEHILTGNGGEWVDGESDQPVPMPLSVESRTALLRQLPADLFDRLRIFCNELGNFRN